MIEAKFGHNKVASFLFKLCAKVAPVLHKHRWLYHLLANTWGLLTSLVGYIVSFALIITGHKPIKFDYIWHFRLGKSWGGVSIGSTFMRDTTSWNRINYHEYGHTYQNAILGPLFIFIVAIPSVIRYWQQFFNNKKGKENKPYDAIWFEDNATQIGLALVKEENK